ncbi:resistance to lethality of mkk1p386 overexpression [Kalmusia sp. IMI 367209]|nr:resistance to lethality of mkk1p386 overexpression [Kalmusia sp. IMI 367209]
MGRRKIEIKAIKDDRNRSVTFLKRKGGLFKKAHELSVLCSVDVAVIIFGHNKKLYEFSSGDINETIGRYQYYGGAHEHKGPEDFMGKKDMDDEDDEEGDMMAGSPPRDSHTPPEHLMGHHLQNNPSFQHIRHTTPSASPPMHNGIPFHARHPSPQPGGLSRPDSRAQMRRPSSNLVPPQHHSQAPPPQNNYAYMPNPPFYNPQAAQGMAPKAPPAPTPPQFQYTHPPAHPQVQFMQQQEQRRQSMPQSFQQPQQPQPQQERPQAQPPPQPQPQTQNQQLTVPSPPQPNRNNFQSPPLPQPKPLPSAAKQHSIFTPIDDSQSMFAQWGTSSAELPRSEATTIKAEPGVRSQSIDVASVSQPQMNGNSPPQPSATQVPNHPQRTQSTSSVPPMPVSRTNSIAKDGSRPRLMLQIPSENSENGSQTAESSPRDSGTTGATPARTSTDTHSSGVVLPPPSPSANSLMSAGATGPPNPFARPAPPANNGSYGSRGEMETPISALPSRFVENGLLPSPSSFYPEWGFGRESNMLPSPLPFQTPVAPNGPSFGRDEPADRKRKTSDEGSEAGSQKRIKA